VKTVRHPAGAREAKPPAVFFRPTRPTGKLMTAALAAVTAFACLAGTAAFPQNPEMEEKVMAIKEAQAANKQKLAQYNWQETETISIKGEVKDTKVYQVEMVNGSQQKTEVSNQQAQQVGREGRLKQHIIEKRKGEYEQYGEQIGSLAKQYTQPDPERLQLAYQQGNVSLQFGGNGTISLVIKNYVKPNDSVTLTINDQTKSPVSVRVASYLNDPKDAVDITAQFGRLPDGTNHIASTLVNGVSKQLTVNEQTSNYQRQ
jgi:hypothetical protein